MSATFYIYCDGSDLEDIAADMCSKIEDFIALYGGRVALVNQRAEKKTEEADSPDWDLGVNFEDEELAEAEKKDLLLFFQSLAAEFGRDFVLGGRFPDRMPEDLVTVSAAVSLDEAIALLGSNGKPEANKRPEGTEGKCPVSKHSQSPSAPHP